MQFQPRLWIVSILILAMVGVALAGPGKDPGIAPPNSKAYGQSLSDWSVDWFIWYFKTNYMGQNVPNMKGHVLFLPLPPLAPEGGDCAAMPYENPCVLRGKAELTVKPGTAFTVPIISWWGATYINGYVDPKLPDAWWGATTDPSFRADVALNGRTVAADLQAYYAPPVDLVPPLYFPVTVPPGPVVAAIFTQGSQLVIHPLSVGRHRLTIRSSGRIPPDNGVLPFGLGQVFDLEWTIIVKP